MSRVCASHAAGHRGFRAIFDRRLALVAAAALWLGALAPVAAEVPTSAWIMSWAASPQAPRGVMAGSFAKRTIRQIVHLSLGGNRARVRLSNEFGKRPLLIGAASLGF